MTPCRATGYLLCLSLSVAAAACGRDTTPQPVPGAMEPAAQAPDAGEINGIVTVTGCLRSDDAGTYALTADAEPLTSLTARAATSDLPTYTYVLTDIEDAAQYVGHQVAVTGSVAATDSVEHQRAQQLRLPDAGPVSEPVAPTTETETEIEIALRSLRVQDIRSIQDRCETGTAR